ncbi:hypothetical protein FRC02_007310 [Tulasnella sp. 418]|nr:hypothetical protein FRC02_007310 [Tulasnella sp. 418]
MESILLARKCNVPQWLNTGYTALCIRPEPMTVEEGALLGFGLFADLFRIRETRKATPCKSCYNWSINITCGTCHAAAQATAAEAVKRLLSKDTESTASSSN